MEERNEAGWVSGRKTSERLEGNCAISRPWNPDGSTLGDGFAIAGEASAGKDPERGHRTHRRNRCVAVEDAHPCPGWQSSRSDPDFRVSRAGGGRQRK